MDDSDYLSYKSMSDDEEEEEDVEDLYGEGEAEWINSMREMGSDATGSAMLGEENKREVRFDAQKAYFYKEEGEEDEDEKIDESQELPTKSLEDLIPILRPARITREREEEEEEKEEEEEEEKKQQEQHEDVRLISPMKISGTSPVASSSGADDLLPSKSRFAPVPKDSVTSRRSVPVDRTPELSGYSRPVLLESDNTISNDIYSPRVTVSLDTAFRQLQGQVTNMQQEVVETREVYQTELQRLEQQLKMTEAKLLQSKVVREGNQSSYNDRDEVPIVLPKSSSMPKQQQQQQQPTQSTTLSASAYSPAHMRIRMEQMSEHEEDAERKIRSLEDRTRKDENNLRMYEEENAMLKDKQRSMEESVRRIQAELDLERQAKLELQDSLLKQGKELKEVKESWQEASGELLSMRPDQKRKEKELIVVTEKLRDTEKRSKDMERELRMMKKEMETLQYENKTSTAEILRLREQIDRIGDDKKQLERDLKRANMIPSTTSSSDDVNKLKKEFDRELKLREDRTRQLESSLTQAQKRISSYETALTRTREGASAEVRRLRQEVSDLETALKLAKRKQSSTTSSSSSIKKNISPLRGSPPPWACDVGFDQYEEDKIMKSAVNISAPISISKEENVRQPKRWATSSDLHWGSNEKQEKKKASGRKHFKSRPASATSVSSVLNRNETLSSSSAVRRQLDLKPTTTTTSTNVTTTLNDTKRSGGVEKIVSASPSSAQRLAPFATDMSEKELKLRVSELEQSLMNFNLEKSRIKNKLLQFGVGAGRTMAKRRAKREMESRLKFLEETTSDILMKLRYFELA